MYTEKGLEATTRSTKSQDRDILQQAKTSHVGTKPILKPSASIPPSNKDTKKEINMYSKALSSTSLQVPATTPHSILSYSLSKDFINLTMLSNELGASNTSLVSNTSRTTSFSGISHIINSLLKSHSVTKISNGLNKDICDAIDANDVTFIQSLIKEKTKENKGCTELIAIRAIEKLNTIMLHLVLNEEELDASVRNNLLFVAVEFDSLECCRLLLKHGLSPNTWRNDASPTTNRN